MNPDILKLFTNHARHVLSQAIDLAFQRRETEVEPIALFASLTLEEGCIAQELLTQSGVSAEDISQFLPSPDNDPLPTYLPLFSGATKGLIEKAAVLAMNAGHAHIGTEHLLLAILEEADDTIEDYFRRYHIEQDELRAHIEMVFHSSSRLSAIAQKREILRTPPSQQTPQHSKQSQSTMPKQKEATHTPAQSTTPALDYFGRELTAEDVVESLDPVIGRDQEIERLIHILSRRTKNNPVLVGDPGVGKTAIVEGLAKRIVEGSVPDALLNKRIMSLDISSLLAGSMYRGEFESRMKQVIDEVRANRDLILFIDEVHMLVGAGGVQGGNLDAANILKPALAKGDIRCIGATTIDEYRKYIENDSALERRFQPIQVHEPSAQEATAILKGLKTYYEQFHNVLYSDDAIAAAVRLSVRYIPEKQLPDKAIDLLDEAGAKARVAQSVPEELKNYEKLVRKLQRITTKKEAAVSQEQFEQAVEYKEQEAVIEKKLDQLLSTVHSLRIPAVHVSERNVAEVVAHMRGIPLSHVRSQGHSALTTLEDTLNKNIIGQQEAIHSIVSTLKRAAVGLSNEHRPMGSFLFMGPSGVGKTLLAKQIASQYFGDPEALIRMDMSEFSESFTVSKLLGAPAGYIGHNDSVKLTDQLRTRPYSVVLFDEIEKAHPDVYNILLQILDEGKLTDSAGRELDFRNTIILLTTNIGLHQFTQQAGLGFDLETMNNPAQNNDQKEKQQAAIFEEMKEVFPIEFLNRIDRHIIFAPLSQQAMVRVVANEFQEIKARLAARGIKARMTPAAKKWIAEKSYSAETGARRIRQVIADSIEEPIAEALLAATDKKKKPTQVVVDTTKKNIIQVTIT